MTTRFNTGGRNYGYGKQIGFAVKNALKDRYGEGKYATRAAHEARFANFNQHLKEEGIKDLKKIDQNTIERYGHKLNMAISRNDMSVAYAQNLLSTVNVVMSQVREDKTLHVSPATVVGQRSHIRTTAPKSIDRTLVTQALAKIETPESKVTVQLAREFGLRFKETALLNLNRAIKEASATGQFNVIEGTKGGRVAERLISVSSKQLTVLKEAKAVAGRFKNIVGKTGSFKQWQNRFAAEYRQSGAQALLGKFHDLRAAYACERYHELTGTPAPVIAGQRTAAYGLDQHARATVAFELGHHRLGVGSSYLGSASQ